MFRKLTAVFLIALSTACLAEPKSSQDMPDNYRETINKYREAGKEIAKDIPAEQKVMFDEIMQTSMKQKKELCEKLILSEIEEEHKAGLKCLFKIAKEVN